MTGPLTWWTPSRTHRPGAGCPVPRGAGRGESRQPWTMPPATAATDPMACRPRTADVAGSVSDHPTGCGHAPNDGTASGDSSRHGRSRCRGWSPADSIPRGAHGSLRLQMGVDEHVVQAVTAAPLSENAHLTRATAAVRARPPLSGPPSALLTLLLHPSEATGVRCFVGRIGFAESSFTYGRDRSRSATGRFGCTDSPLSGSRRR